MYRSVILPQKNSFSSKAREALIASGIVSKMMHIGKQRESHEIHGPKFSLEQDETNKHASPLLPMRSLKIDRIF
jgi:hypothetical protein